MRTISLCGYGVTVSVSGPVDLLAAIAATAMPGMAPEGSAAPLAARYEACFRDGRWRLSTAGVLIASHIEVAQLAAAFWHDAEVVVAAAARDPVFVHAGAVAVDGAGVLVPGRSGTGKSSLVHALLGEGARYLSDEFALLDAHGLVHPYPKALRLGDAYQKLGDSTPAIAVPVGLVVLTAYDRAASWLPRVASGGEIALALVANAVAAKTRPAETLAAAGAVASQSMGIKSPRGSADAVAQWLVSWCRRRVAHSVLRG